MTTSQTQGARPAIPTRRKLVWAAVVTAGFLLLITVLGSVLERTRVVDGAYLDPDSADRSMLVSLEPVGDGNQRELRAGACHRALVPAQRLEGSLRVLIVGGSYAQGTPYGCDPQDGQVRQGMTHQGATSDWLQAVLERAHPGQPLQVINLGLSRARSRNLVELVDTMLELEPDLVVVLAGNNDTQPPPDDTHQVLADWPAYRAAHELLWPAASAGSNAGLSYDPQMMEAMAQDFEHNLELLVTTLRQHDLAVLLGTLPVNARWDGRMGTDSVLDMPSDWKVPKPWPMLAATMLGAPLEQRCDEAILDDQQRGLLRALPCAELARHAACAPEREALAAWQALADRCPTMHTRPSMNDFIRAQAQRGEGVHLVDVDAAFLAASLDGLPDPNLFMDYCHATWRGYHLTALSIADAIHEAGLLPSPAQPPNPDPQAIIEQLGWHEVPLAAPRFRLGTSAPPAAARGAPPPER
jgi:lysophospholipase L1-like esterase